MINFVDFSHFTSKFEFIAVLKMAIKNQGSEETLASKWTNHCVINQKMKNLLRRLLFKNRE
jgi:hypothetical protein